jgi:DNA (cytosine-5)-methyltransferase 1
MKAVSLFSGIGGIELGLQRRDVHAHVFCEIDPIARKILKNNFPNALIVDDVVAMTRLPKCDIVTAGFPCQDLSQAGSKRGINGTKSGLVSKLFQLIEDLPLRSRPKALLIENVPYMLRLDRGKAMHYLTSRLRELGYEWAYRTVDARCFGLPQRRPRVVLLASREFLPETVLFADDVVRGTLDGKPSEVDERSWYGFYWTEGSRGVGWAKDAVPPIKCGSTLGIASPPAVWVPRRDFVGTPDIRDAERLQGFPEGWTDFETHGISAKPSLRWRLVGNAVSTELSAWIGDRLRNPAACEAEMNPIVEGYAWPIAACSRGSRILRVHVGPWASRNEQVPLQQFLRHPLKPLSSRATDGFLKRAGVCTNVVYAPAFLRSLHKHSRSQSPAGGVVK